MLSQVYRRRYICNGQDEIMHGLRPRVKCVAPLFRDMSLAKVVNAAPPPPVAPMSRLSILSILKCSVLAVVLQSYENLLALFVCLFVFFSFSDWGNNINR